MNAVAQHIPSLYEELNRKTIDAIVWLTESEQQGLIRADQADIAKHAIFMSVAGLVDPEITAKFLSFDPSAAPGVLIDPLMREDKVLLLLTRPDRCELKIIGLSDAPAQQTRCFGSMKDTHKARKQALLKFIEAGYKRL